MTNLVTGVIGILLVVIFLGIMLWWIKALPIIIIVSVVMLMLLYDFIHSLRANNNRQ
jgi:hypothetical protein